MMHPNPYASPAYAEAPVAAELADETELPELRAAHRTLIVALFAIGGLFAAEGASRGEYEKAFLGAALAAAGCATAKKEDVEAWKNALG